MQAHTLFDQATANGRGFRDVTPAAVAELRASWKNYLRVDDGEPRGMALAYSRAGLYCTLDDHEVTNDFNPETQDLAFHTRRADILVAAIGKPRFVTGDMI